MTIIEGTVVLFLCAVVAAILFPIFVHTPRRDTYFTCMSLEKQIGLAMMQYLQDNNEALPPRQTATSGHLGSWRGFLNPYLAHYGGSSRVRQMFKCPSDPYADLPDFEHDGYPRSYAVNGTLGGSFGNDHPILSLDIFDLPESVILVCESTASFGDFDPLNPGFFARQAHEGRNGGCMQMHMRYSNFVFADGHAKSLKPLLTLGASSDQPLNYWTIDNHPFSLPDLKTAQYTLGYAVEKAQQH